MSLSAAASLPEECGRKTTVKAQALELNRVLEEFLTEPTPKDMQSFPSMEFRASLTLVFHRS